MVAVAGSLVRLKKPKLLELAGTGGERGFNVRNGSHVRSLAQCPNQLLQILTQSLGSDFHGSVAAIAHPAVDIQAARFLNDEHPIANALDMTFDNGVQTVRHNKARGSSIIDEQATPSRVDARLQPNRIKKAKLVEPAY